MTKRISSHLLVATCVLSAAYASAAGSNPQPTERTNILFIAVDDLRPSLGCYGDPRAIRRTSTDYLNAAYVSIGRTARSPSVILREPA